MGLLKVFGTLPMSPLTGQQLNFLGELFKDEDTIRVDVVEEDGRFIATIGGGWWSASGSMADSAVKSAVALYEGENV